MVFSFGSEVAAGFISSAAGGALVLYLGYRFVEQKLRLQDTSARRLERDLEREQARVAVLGAIHSELEGAATLLGVMLAELPQGAIPYPGFDLTGWPLVSQAVVFTTLRQETIEALTHAYNRMSTANEQLRFLSDLNHGPTAIIATANAAGRLADEEVAAAYRQFIGYRDAVRGGLVDRLRDLKGHLDTAIDRVEEDTKRTAEMRARQRIYVPSEQPTVIDVPASEKAPNT
ncbi:MAG TPA: hypothetical protein VF101_16360 [Gaiellaceae bacterium]